MKFSKKTLISILGTLCLLAGGGSLLGFDKDPIVFESLESKTIQNGPVFNRVAWFPGWARDVWMMQQSHKGLAPPFHEWDRLAIVIDKTTFPRSAIFYQIEPGALKWDPNAPMKPLHVQCFMCHSNGPRALRPQLESKDIALSAWDQARVILWNLRIKTYGRIESTADGDPLRFKFTGAFENEKLHVQTCAKCHNDSFWGRGSLTRQNFLAIDFMVSRHFMPPPGFALKAGERERISAFTRGLPQ